MRYYWLNFYAYKNLYLESLAIFLVQGESLYEAISSIKEYTVSPETVWVSYVEFSITDPTYIEKLAKYLNRKLTSEDMKLFDDPTPVVFYKDRGCLFSLKDIS